MTTPRNVRIAVVCAFAAIMLAAVSRAQVELDIGSCSFAVEFAEIPDNYILNGSAKISSDGSVALSAAVGELGVSLDLFDPADAKLVAGKTVEVDLAAWTNGAVNGSAAATLGLQLKGLPKAVADLLRGRCVVLRMKQSIRLRNSNPADQDILVPPQIARAKGAEAGKCKVEVHPDGAVSFEFDLAAACDDQHKSPPSVRSYVVGFEPIDRCVSDRLARSGDLAAMIARGGLSAMIIQQTIWEANAWCAAEAMSTSSWISLASANSTESLRELLGKYGQNHVVSSMRDILFALTWIDRDIPHDDLRQVYFVQYREAVWGLFVEVGGDIGFPAYQLITVIPSSPRFTERFREAMPRLAAIIGTAQPLIAATHRDAKLIISDQYHDEFGHDALQRLQQQVDLSGLP